MMLFGILGGLHALLAATPSAVYPSTWQRYALPATTALLGIDMERLKRTPWYRYIGPHGQNAAGSPQAFFDAFTARTGFDLRQHVRTWLVAWWYQTDGTMVLGTRVGYLAMGWGPLEAAKQTEVLRQHGAHVHEVHGQRVFGFDPDPSPPSAAAQQTRAVAFDLPPFAIAFPEPDMILVGPPAQVSAALTRRTSTTSASAVPNGFVQQMHALAPLPPIWMIDHNPAQFWLQRVPGAGFGMSPVAPLLQGMEHATARLELADQISARMHVTCRSVAHTQVLLVLTRGMLAFGQAPGLRQSIVFPSFLTDMTLEAEQTTLKLSTLLDAPDVEALFKIWGSP
jgi:hypothetical protein